MKYGNYFKDMIESIPDYSKIVLLIFLIKNHVDILEDCGFLKSDNNCLSLEFKKKLLEQNVENLEYIKNEE